MNISTIQIICEKAASNQLRENLKLLDYFQTKPYVLNPVERLNPLLCVDKTLTALGFIILKPHRSRTYGFQA